jgi:hypothetical protein
MKSAYKINLDDNRFDLSAIKIFISVIAIFLSATMPNALATTEKSDSANPSAISKIITDLKKQETESILRVDQVKSHCNARGGNSVSNQSSAHYMIFTNDFVCPKPHSFKEQNNS